VQPLLSVTKTEYVPALRPEIDGEEALFDQLNENGAVPPATVTDAEPFDPPKQLTFEPEHEAVILHAANDTVAQADVVHP